TAVLPPKFQPAVILSERLPTDSAKFSFRRLTSAPRKKSSIGLIWSQSDQEELWSINAPIATARSGGCARRKVGVRSFRRLKARIRPALQLRLPKMRTEETRGVM